MDAVEKNSKIIRSQESKIDFWDIGMGLDTEIFTDMWTYDSSSIYKWMQKIPSNQSMNLMICFIV